MLTLWGRPNSSNVKKVLWTLEELALPYDHIKVGGSYGGLDDPDYLAINPNGKVPTLRDGALVLWESNTIVRYLVARYGQATCLWLEEPQARAAAEKWMDWGANMLFPAFHDILFHTLRLPEAQRDPAIVARGIQDFEKALAIMEAELAHMPWLSGVDFGVGDIVAGVFISYYYEMDLVRHGHFPHIEAWYQKLQQRPAYRKIVMIPID